MLKYQLLMWLGCFNMMNRMPLNNWIDEFLKGNFDASDVKTQIKAGWYDWFCKDSSLVNKTKKMGNIIKQIRNGGKVNLGSSYVWFKNNCPLNGPLYDDFRIANLVTGEVQFTIQINCCWNKSVYTVYGWTPDGEGHWDESLFECNNRKELINWLNSSWD